jgi:hypothetical protein
MKLFVTLLALVGPALAFAEVNVVPPHVIPEPRQVSSDDLPPPVKPEPRQSSCRYNHTFSSVGSQAAIQSPNYPNSYPAYSDCRYTLKSPAGSQIKLECNDFNVESATNCQYDMMFVSLTGDLAFGDANKACGKGTFELLSKSNSLTIGFTSDSSNPSSTVPFRFSCLLTVVGTAAPVATTAAPTTTKAPLTTTTTTAATKPVSNSTCTCGVRNEVC